MSLAKVTATLSTSTTVTSTGTLVSMNRQSERANWVYYSRGREWCRLRLQRGRTYLKMESLSKDIVRQVLAWKAY